MGAALIRSAFSANIKERRDCSTALFDERGRMVTQAEHIPVHLGAMPDAVAAVMAPRPGARRAVDPQRPVRGRHAPPRPHDRLPRPSSASPSRARTTPTSAAPSPGACPPARGRSTRRASSSRRRGSTTRRSTSLVARMRNPDERRGDLRAQLAAHRLAERADRGALRAARPRRASPRRWTSSSRTRSAVVRAAIRELPDGRYEARRPPRDARRPARHPRGGHDRRRRDRHRLRRHRAAARRQPQLPARRHALGLLLRRPLPDRAGPARLGRRVRPGHGARARRAASSTHARPPRSPPGTSRRRAGSPTSSSPRSRRRFPCRRRARGR